MKDPSTCPVCGAPLAQGGRSGMCPTCLLRAAMGGDSLQDPASGADGVAQEPPRLSEYPGTRIGHYKLLEQIGEGGFGIVWMAEQEEPVRRRVALKIIKLGMDTHEVVARFEAERQALAMMEHPNIASVFDGGATATGRPYFVMELVKGVPITTYCDANQLTTRERLELFLEVCHAVQHAHQKGVIHRDLKPSNILVTVKDDRAVPKVIDFGIAKATQAALTEKTLFTCLNQWIGTPTYMSPEQAGLGSLDVDTRSDIYSLGVLLYELLTGRPPFDTRTLLTAGYDAVMRVIREDDPPRPSTRLSTLTEEELTTVATQRGAEPAMLNRSLRGDLDWIVMKALEKDRRRRYETANGLAADLRRHLDNEPVLARPPGTAYRFGKLVSRYRGFFAALAAILVCLSVGLAVSTFAVLRAHQALKSKELERLRAERAQAEALTAREEAELQLARAEAERTAARQAEGRAVAAKKAADYQRTRAERQTQETETHRLEAERQKLAAQNAQSEAETQRAKTLEERRMAEDVIAGLQYELQDRFAESGKLALLDGFADRVVNYYDKLSVEADSPHTRREKTVAMNFKANVLAVKGQTAEAIKLYRQVLAFRQRLAADAPADRQAQSDVAQSYLKIALMLKLPAEEADVCVERGLKILGNLAKTGPLTPHQEGIKNDITRLGEKIRKSADSRQPRATNRHLTN